MDEIFYIKKCLELIERKIGWRDRSTWVFDDFKRLREMIFEASGTSLSVHTLERLFGKLKTHKNYNPQNETKKALAVFLGYDNWKHFKAEQAKDLQAAAYAEQGNFPLEPNKSYTTLDKDQSEKTSKPSLAKKVTLFIIVGVVAVSAYALLNLNRDNRKVMPEVNFTASNVYGTRPHTVKFSFNLSGVEAKNISIDFGTGKPIENIGKNQTHLYKTYLSPGIFNVHLKGDDKVIAATSVFIKMNSWKASTFTTYENPETQNPIPDTITSRDGRLYTPPQLLGDLVEPGRQYFVQYLKVGDFKVNGDNMTFEARFRNIHRFNYQICFDMWFKLIGSKGVLKMHFLKSGCAGFVQMIFGETVLNGHKQDLSAFTKEFHNWKKARMEVKDKHVSIYFEDELIFTTSYQRSVGKIHGVSITSKGSGQTDYVRFYDNQDELVYAEDF